MAHLTKDLVFFGWKGGERGKVSIEESQNFLRDFAWSTHDHGLLSGGVDYYTEDLKKTNGEFLTENFKKYFFKSGHIKGMVTEDGVVAGYRLDDGESSFGRQLVWTFGWNFKAILWRSNQSSSFSGANWEFILKNQVVHLLREITGSDDQYCIAKNYSMYLDGKITTVAFYRIPRERREAEVREYNHRLMFVLIEVKM